MQAMRAQGMSYRGYSKLGAIVSSLALGFCFAGCAESTPPPAEAEDERSGEGASEGGEAAEAPLAGTTTVASNPFAVPEDASVALRQAEWLREEQSRAFRVLEMQIEQGGASCDEARSSSESICSMSDRVCEQAEIDDAARTRCDDSMERCGAARTLIRPTCGG